MSYVTYSEKETQAIQPLLLSIAKEIRERTAFLSVLVATLDELNTQGNDPKQTRQVLTAEAAAHRRGILRAKHELEELGCSLLRRSPVTIHIPGRDEGEDRTVIWKLNPRKRGHNDEIEEIVFATHAPVLPLDSHES